MPMDKYQQQSEKSNLWARRRNKTADLLLDGQLRYLEKTWRQGVKQHLRGKFRLEEELRALVNISEGYRDDSDHISNSSDFGPRRARSCLEILRKHQTERSTPTSSKKSCNLSSNQRPLSASRNFSIKTEYLRNEHVNVDGISQEVPCREKIDCLKHDLAETRFPRQDGSELEKSAIFENGHQCIYEHSRQAVPMSLSEPKIRPFSEKSSLRCTSSCKFVEDGKLWKTPCKHFPCLIPNTYHALGFRRDDITTWSQVKFRNSFSNSLSFSHGTSEDILSRDSKYPNNYSNLIREIENNAVDLTQTKVIDLKHKQDSEDSEHYGDKESGADKNLQESEEMYANVVPKWMRGKQPKQFSFRPASGPTFGPKPRDPILEHVRQGLQQSQPPDRPAPRMTVAGRMRGLRSLVHEMREKHERAKPVDWSVNYGQRLPMRVLLNPVIPETVL
ncbi:hypothetical protein EGW08_022690 [Elysia chlorotica]|uniref:Uncharacterized protein n=1 Tax=Elysia chlorotica TaxID=188477 RepID=A0A433SK90_ELYCH|nr:hypothetical protein EGW08_022690 [Elysia chlorotica]